MSTYEQIEDQVERQLRFAADAFVRDALNRIRPLFDVPAESGEKELCGIYERRCACGKPCGHSWQCASCTLGPRAAKTARTGHDGSPVPIVGGQNPKCAACGRAKFWWPKSTSGIKHHDEIRDIGHKFVAVTERVGGDVPADGNIVNSELPTEDGAGASNTNVFTPAHESSTPVSKPPMMVHAANGLPHQYHPSCDIEGCVPVTDSATEPDDDEVVDYRDHVREILCRVFTDGADAGYEEWQAWYKPAKWLSPYRALGGFIWERLSRVAPAPVSQPDAATIRNEYERGYSAGAAYAASWRNNVDTLRAQLFHADEARKAAESNRDHYRKLFHEAREAAESLIGQPAVTDEQRERVAALFREFGDVYDMPFDEPDPYEYADRVLAALQGRNT